MILLFLFFLFFRLYYSCFNFSNVEFMVPVCPSTLSYFKNSFIWSYKIFVNSSSTHLTVLIDEEDKSNKKFVKNIENELKNLSHKIIFGKKPAYKISNYDRAQMYFFWADNFTNSEYVAFVDTDTLFTAKVHFFDLFVNEKPRISAFLRDTTQKEIGLDLWWQKLAKVTENSIGKPQPFQSMSYFPVVIKTIHLQKIRSHLQNIAKSINFDSAMFSLIIDNKEYFLRPNSKPKKYFVTCFSQFHIMTSYLWYYEKDSYYWDIVPFIRHKNVDIFKSDFIQNLMKKADIKIRDLHKYLPRVAVHLKYENLMSFKKMQIYSLCFALSIYGMHKKYLKCNSINHHELNLLQWSFQSYNFSNLRKCKAEQSKRDMMVNSCSSLATFDIELIEKTLL